MRGTSLLMLLILGAVGPALGTNSSHFEDPYLEEARASCNKGSNLSCFKARALSALPDPLQLEKGVQLGEHIRLVRAPKSELLRLAKEPYDTGRTWSGLHEPSGFFSFLFRRLEQLVKSTALVLDLPSTVTEHGRFAPRFIDEIYHEFDTIDDKNEKPYKRDQLKKLFIPLLFILKLFKLKLLLFLPLLLGFASFKKFLGIAAVVLPLIISYFKVCKPDIGMSYGSYGHSNYYNPPSNKYQYYSDDNGQNYYAQDQAYKGYYNR